MLKIFLKKKNQIEENNYLYPIDFSIIKRVFHTHKAETYKFGKKIKISRFINIPPGITIIYKYIGPIVYTESYLKILEKKFKLKQEDIFTDIKNYKIILCSDLGFLEEILNQNYFLVHIIFNSDINADPNDFRRSLLGLKRIYKEELKSPNPDIPNDIKNKFIEYINGNSLKMDDSFILSMNFSIIKRPILLYSDEKAKKPHKIYEMAAGVIVLYKYIGPINYIEQFRKAFEDVFKKLQKDNALFKKAKNILILVGTDLNMYKNFNKNN